MAEYQSLPFRESIQFFRQKLNLPTRAWTDIWEGMHSRAFVVAGVVQTELLTDFRTAIDKAIVDGTTLQEFRKDFDKIVNRHGWSYKGGRGWRSRVIYETNLRTAYQAGRYKQLKDPDLLKVRPLWRYKHSDSVVSPRPEHVSWDGLVLPHDDPFWQTHYPPNGWGCRCKIYAENERTLKKKGIKVGKAPPLEMQEQTVGTRGPSPRTVKVPKGIDPGFAHNVGESAWGKPLSEQAMREVKGDWQPLTFGGPENFNRPHALNAVATKTKLGRRLKDSAATSAALKKLLKADEKIYTLKQNKFQYAINVNAEILGGHIDMARTPFLPLLPELLESPQEAWMTFEKHRQTGKVALRIRLLKVIETDKQRSMILVADAQRGQLEAWTFIPSTKIKELQKRRRGLLVYFNEED